MVIVLLVITNILIRCDIIFLKCKNKYGDSKNGRGKVEKDNMNNYIYFYNIYSYSVIFSYTNKNNEGQAT